MTFSPFVDTGNNSYTLKPRELFVPILYSHYQCGHMIRHRVNYQSMLLKCGIIIKFNCGSLSLQIRVRYNKSKYQLKVRCLINVDDLSTCFDMLINTISSVK